MQSATDYGPYIQNLATPLHTSTLLEACTQLLVDQWSFLRANVGLAAVHAAVAHLLNSFAADPG